MKYKETPEAMLARIMLIAALLAGEPDDERNRYREPRWTTRLKSQHAIKHVNKPGTKIVQPPKNDVS
jgi:hypothetical protein